MEARLFIGYGLIVVMLIGIAAIVLIVRQRRARERNFRSGKGRAKRY